MSQSALEDLVDACRVKPGSAALLRALLAEAEGSDAPWVAAEHLSDADPTPFDAALRREVAAFLRAADRSAAADAWDPRVRRAEGHGRPGEGPAEVVSLNARRAEASALPPDTAVPPTVADGPGRERITFADVGGLADVKSQIRRKIITPFEKPGLFERFKRRAGGGVLMYGPPGCGKTMLARATAGEAGAAFIPIEIPDVIDMWIGESEKKLAAAFHEARSRKPAVLFFDELEALAAKRQYGPNDHKASMVSTFLSAFDGVGSNNEGVLVLAATNVPWAIDSAFRRPGRFDRVLFVPPPDRIARKEILAGLLKGRPLAPDVDPDRLSQATSGFSGADLRNLVETGVDLAIDDSRSDSDIEPVARRHLEAALKEVKPTTLEWLSTARNYAKYANEGGAYDEVLAFLDKHGR